MNLTDAMVDDLVTGAAELAAEMASWSEDDITRALAEVQDNLRGSLSQQLGSNAAAIIATAFARTVIRHRAELQATGFRNYGHRLQ